MNDKKNIVTIIKRNSTTGKIVWVYRGKSQNAGRKAYWLVSKRENTRIRSWKKRLERRTAIIKEFLQRLIDGLPTPDDLTPDQRKAIRELQKIADNPPKCDTQFYNHLQQERKRKKRDKEIRQKMREREQRILKTDMQNS